MPAGDPALSSACSRLPAPELHVCAQVPSCCSTASQILPADQGPRGKGPGQPTCGEAPPQPQAGPARLLTFVLRLLLLLVHLGVVPGVHLLLQGLQLALVVLGTEVRLWLHAETRPLGPSPPDAAPPSASSGGAAGT